LVIVLIKLQGFVELAQGGMYVSPKFRIGNGEPVFKGDLIGKFLIEFFCKFNIFLIKLQGFVELAQGRMDLSEFRIGKWRARF
jgi:hypothetical protein